MKARSLLATGLGIGLAFAFAACSGSSDSASPGTSPEGGAAGDETGTNNPSGDGSTSTTDGMGPVVTTIPKPTACPTAKYKTLVVMGDSISDVGGSGGTADQMPFYRTILVKNDDTLYPDYKGFDLATCMGLDPVMNVVKVSKGGAVATVPSPNAGTDPMILLNQATSIPATLPGPVLIVGTIGGNDVQAGLVTVLTGTPAQVQTKVDAFAAGFGMAMAELTKVDRFGAGVKADVLMTNIYDPSGGTGHFYYEPKMATCPGALGFWPDKKETASQLATWNTAMTTEAKKYTGVHIIELEGPFVAHSVSSPTATNWFFQDCIHPNSAGQNAVRGVFYAGIVALQ